jgi:hypothetical protein
MSDVFQVLKADHEAVEAVLGRLETGRPPAEAGAAWLRAREKPVEGLVIEQSKHEAVEEEFFSS